MSQSSIGSKHASIFKLAGLLSVMILSVCGSLCVAAQTTPALDASFVSQSVVTTMTTNQSYVVSVAMRNTGTDTWLPGTAIKLGTQNPVNSTYWGTGRAELGATVSPGQTATFTFAVQAPASAGTYNFQWKMLKEGYIWFGAASTNLAISVARKVTNSPPVVTMTAPVAGASQVAPASVTLTADASDVGGSIAYVNFISNGVIAGTDASAPYSLALGTLPAGSYSFQAMAVDNGSSTTTSTAISYTVTAPPPPPPPTATVSATRSYVYDSSQRLCKSINPESGATVTAYDVEGKIDWIAEGTTLTGSTCDRASVPEALKTYRRYDSMDRVISVLTPGGAADLSTTYELDGQATSITASNPGNASVTTTYRYNKRRLLVGETSTNGLSVLSLVYTYDANGFQSALSYPDNQTVVYSPDALGRATEVRAAGGQTYASGITYYPGGAIKGFTYGNGVVHSMLQNLRRLPSRSLDQFGATKILDDSYAFDPNGNVTDITDQAQGGLTTRGMSYDALDRLKIAVSPGQWGNATWSYDALDNIRSADQGARQLRYYYDGTNRLASIDNSTGALPYTLGYDARGNTTSRNGQSLVFDAANRLSQVTGLQSYRYDGLGRRVQTTDSDGKTTFWIYSQGGQVSYTSEARRSQNLAYIYLGNTQVATRATAWGSGAVSVRHEHTDSLGSPVAESGPTGAVLKRNSFTAYGEPWGGTSVDGAGYTGHVMDQGTGLTYMQQRYYGQSLGRFLSVDPAGAGFNLYDYANNSPYTFTDPDGRIPDKERINHALAETGKALLPAIALAGQAADWLNSNVFIPLGPIAFEASGPLEVLSMGVEALTASRGAAEVAEVAPVVSKEIRLTTQAHGEAATHAAEAIKAGHPDLLTIARPGAQANRTASTGGMAKVPGKQLDEYPPAMFREGGAGASVKPINPSNNMSAGACIGNACRGLPNGATIKIVVDGE